METSAWWDFGPGTKKRHPNRQMPLDGDQAPLVGIPKGHTEGLYDFVIDGAGFQPLGFNLFPERKDFIFVNF